MNVVTEKHESHHVGAGCNFHKQNEEGIAEVAPPEGVAYPDIEVEEVRCHESAEEANPHRVCMYLHANTVDPHIRA